MLTSARGDSVSARARRFNSFVSTSIDMSLSSSNVAPCTSSTVSMLRSSQSLALPYPESTFDAGESHASERTTPVARTGLVVPIRDGATGETSLARSTERAATRGSSSGGSGGRTRVLSVPVQIPFAETTVGALCDLCTDLCPNAPLEALQSAATGIGCAFLWTMPLPSLPIGLATGSRFSFSFNLGVSRKTAKAPFWRMLLLLLLLLDEEGVGPPPARLDAA